MPSARKVSAPAFTTKHGSDTVSPGVGLKVGVEITDEARVIRRSPPRPESRTVTHRPSPRSRVSSDVAGPVSPKHAAYVRCHGVGAAVTASARGVRVVPLGVVATDRGHQVSRWWGTVTVTVATENVGASWATCCGQLGAHRDAYSSPAGVPEDPLAWLHPDRLDDIGFAFLEPVCRPDDPESASSNALGDQG